MTDTVQEIKDRLNIVDVVAPYVQLKKAGKYQKGLSPFVTEKTPSFFVTPDKGLYHCFASGKGGDMFTFIEEMEGVDFKGALKILAEKAGVEITQVDSGARDKKEKIFHALALSEKYFVQALEKNDAAKKYIQGRGLRDEVSQAWAVGYAPNEWRLLSEYLEGQGVESSVLLEAGLVKKAEGDTTKKPYDTFRGRIMFPIRDVAGKVVGFSGRLFDEPKSGVTLAKYLNSPETLVFDKSRVLYGLDYARHAIRKYNFVILVEGQFDLLMAHQAGYTNAVALSGTGFTEGHAKLLKRYTDNLVIAFDSDRAGVSAAGRAAQIALMHGINVKITRLPSNEDPADVIQKDVAVWKRSIKEAEHVVQFYLNHIKAAKLDARAFKLEVSRVVLPYITLIENAIDKAHFVQVVAQELSVPDSAVLQEIEKIKNTEPALRTNAQQEEAPKASSIEGKSAPQPFMSRADILERFVFGILFSLTEDGNESLVEKVSDHLKETLGEEEYGDLLKKYETDHSVVIEGDVFLENATTDDNQYDVIVELLSDFRREIAREE